MADDTRFDEPTSPARGPEAAAAGGSRGEDLAGFVVAEPAREHSAGEHATPPTPASRRRLAERAAGVRFPFLVYLATRLVILADAAVNGAFRHRSIGYQLTHWDGVWYLRLATRGYPTIATHHHSTLGFFPLYPMLIWVVGHAFDLPLSLVGILISGIGGFVAVLLVGELARGWWGEETARRAMVWFCVFPGSVVFSMAYSEGLLIPLAAGCLLAFSRRRFLLAGALAGVATAVGPDAIVLVLVCAVAFVGELRRNGVHSPDTRRALGGLVLSPAGLIAFLGFLWAWTGTPLATLWAQRNGWGEQTEPLALLHQAEYLVREVFVPGANPINLNIVAGLVGAVILAGGLVLLFRRPSRATPEVIAWVAGIAFLTVTSEHVPPNARMLLTAFPAILVYVRYLGRRGYERMVAVWTVLLVVMSALTFIGPALRP